MDRSRSQGREEARSNDYLVAVKKYGSKENTSELAGLTVTDTPATFGEPKTSRRVKCRIVCPDFPSLSGLSIRK